MSASVLETEKESDQALAAAPHFVVNKSELVKELSFVVGGAATKTTIPILSNVLMVARSGLLRLTTTDLSVGLYSSCAAICKAEGVFTIPAKKLFDFVRLLPEGSVEFKVGKNNWLSISAGRSKTRIAGMSAELFPVLPSAGEGVCSVKASGLAQAMAGVQIAISQTETRFSLAGALFEVDDCIRLTATDGHRLSQAEISEGGTSQHKGLFPLGGIKQFTRLNALSSPDDIADVDWSDNHVHVSIQGRGIIANLLTGSFPDYSRVLPKSFTKTAVVDREALKSCLERVRNFADGMSKATIFDFSEGQLAVSARTADTGESDESMPIEYKGDPIKISFNADYIVEALAVSTSKNVVLSMNDPANPIQIEPVIEDGNTSQLVIVMPMRI